MKYISIICLVGLLIWACENPLEDFKLSIKDPITVSKVDLHFYNPSGALPEKMKLTVSGKDAANIVTSLNTKNFRISKEGVSVLAVNPEIKPSAENPIQFTIIVEAEGFAPVIRQFVFTSQYNQDYWFPLFSKSSPPSGVSTSESLVPSTSNGVGSTTTIKTENVKKQENASLTLPSGSVLKDQSGTAVTGDLKLVFNHFDSNASGFLPTGGVAAYPVDKMGNTLANPFDFVRLGGFISVELSNVGGQIVKSLSQAFKAQIELSANLVNPNTGVPIKVGDVLSLSSYDVEANRWMVEDDVKVEKDGQSGKFFVQFSAGHLTYFVVGWRREICRVGPTFVFKSQLKDVDLAYYCQLINADNGKVFRDYWVNYNNGASLTIYYVPKEVERVKLVAYAYNNVFGGNLTQPIATSEVVSLCGERTLNLDITSLAVPPLIDYAVELTCPGGKVLDEPSIPAEFRVQYSEPNKNNWQYLLTLTRYVRQARTYKLVVGNHYDLRLSTDGGVTWPYKQLNFFIEKSKSTISLEAEDYCK